MFSPGFITSFRKFCRANNEELFCSVSRKGELHSREETEDEEEKEEEEEEEEGGKEIFLEGGEEEGERSFGFIFFARLNLTLAIVP